MKEILRNKKGFKINRAMVREIRELPLGAEDVVMKNGLIHTLVPMGLSYVLEVLEEARARGRDNGEPKGMD